ncbi:hypothetical protein MKX03_010988 [Papaver bracteatum]|nr:hypothetical protein MKX03_010988 [Papaver bracteatum]
MSRRCVQTHNTVSSCTCSSRLPNQIKEKKLLVLDLDETLVHTVVHSRSLPIKRKNTRSFIKTCDFSFTDEGWNYYIKKRPFAQEFLKRASELFNLVIFTAGEQSYADPVLDYLDPQRKLIVGRYYNDSIVYLVDDYIKDLSMFGVDLAKVILVDNRPTNFCFQRDNGIPIRSWYSDPHDEELSTLVPFLERLAAADDVRPIIGERFSRNAQEKWWKINMKKAVRLSRSWYTKATRKMGQKFYYQEGENRSSVELYGLLSIAMSYKWSEIVRSF